MFGNMSGFPLLSVCAENRFSARRHSETRSLMPCLRVRHQDGLHVDHRVDLGPLGPARLPASTRKTGCTRD